MKIAIFILAIILINIVPTEEICRNVDINLYSTTLAKKQTFRLDVKNIRGVSFGTNEDKFKEDLIPLQQVGFLLNRIKGSEEKLEPAHKEYIRDEKEQVWLPYSYVQSWRRTGFQLAAQMARTSTSQTNKPVVYFDFINDREILNVSDKDMDDFLSKIKYNTGKRIIVKTAVKDKVLIAQNTYLAADKLITTTKTNNKKREEQIKEQELLLQVSIKKITDYEIQIEQLEKKKNTQTEVKENKRGLLADLLERLRILEGLLESQKTDLKNFTVDPSIKTSQYYVTQQCEGMFYYTTAPKEFKNEFAISKQATNTNVNKAYEKCDKTPKNAVPCGEATMVLIARHKKLRKSFF